MSQEFQSPFNALPPVIVALAVVIGGIEVMFQLANAGVFGGAQGVGWRLNAIEDFGVLDTVWHWMVSNGIWPWEQMRRFLTYPLIHASGLHALMVVVFVLAMGNFVARAFNPLAVLAVFWLSAVMGGLAFVVVLDPAYPLIGGYAGAYGLIGAFTFLIWMRIGVEGGNQNQAFTLIAMLMVIQIIFGVINFEFGNVVAELTGFLTGFFASFVLSPGGWARVLARLRQR